MTTFFLCKHEFFLTLYDNTQYGFEREKVRARTHVAQ